MYCAEVELSSQTPTLISFTTRAAYQKWNHFNKIPIIGKLLEVLDYVFGTQPSTISLTIVLNRRH